MAHIAVVGAGVGGLSAAVRLAAQGHQVEIFEQSADIGGKLGHIKHRGFHFDTGPSLVTLPAVYRDLFATTGAPLSECLDLVPVDPAFRYHFPDGTSFDMPNVSRGRVSATLEQALGPGAGAQWLALLDRAERMWAATREPFLCSPLAGWRTLARLSTRFADLRTIAPGRTLRRLGEDYLEDPRLRMLLDRYATYAGSDPRRAPAALATIAYVEQTFGAWYLRGGLRTLGLALAQRVRELGGVLHLDRPVLEVLIEGGRAAGVRTLVGPHRADIVVANADATALYGDLLPRTRRTRAPRRALSRCTPSLSGFV
ncbi:MAG: phytoene desaturase family protein, partial [Angustibacter sp.]